MNSLHIMGRLGKDPEMRTTNSGKNVCTFSVAVDSWKKDENGNKITNWFNVTCFGTTAEVASNYLEKGRQVVVEGSIEFRTYTDRDGNERWTHDVIANRIHFAGGSQGERQHGPAAGRSNNGIPAPSPDEFDPFSDE